MSENLNEEVLAMVTSLHPNVHEFTGEQVAEMLFDDPEFKKSIVYAANKHINRHCGLSKGEAGALDESENANNLFTISIQGPSLLKTLLDVKSAIKVKLDDLEKQYRARQVLGMDNACIQNRVSQLRKINIEINDRLMNDQ